MWVAAAEADGTRRTMVFLISCLLGIAVLLTGITIWYWFFTRPDDDPDDDPDEGSDDDPGVGNDPVAEAPAEPILDLAEVPIEVSSPGDDHRVPSHPEMPLEPSALLNTEPGVSGAELDSDGELVTETSERGREFSDDGWDAIQQSVFDKFQR